MNSGANVRVEQRKTEVTNKLLTIFDEKCDLRMNLSSSCSFLYIMLRWHLIGDDMLVLRMKLKRFFSQSSLFSSLCFAPCHSLPVAL